VYHGKAFDFLGLRERVEEFLDRAKSQNRQTARTLSTVIGRCGGTDRDKLDDAANIVDREILFAILFHPWSLISGEPNHPCFCACANIGRNLNPGKLAAVLQELVLKVRP
jgi:hypothetical protein